MADCVVFRDLTLGYDSHPAVHHLSGTVKTGSLTAVVGANGSGKSTLMKGIVGVLKPMAGSAVRAPDQTIAYLPQQSELDRSFPARVVDLVALIQRWHGEKRTVMVVVHDLNLVREQFPETLLMARRPIAWGPTAEVLRPENLLKARRFDEAWHDDAPWCEPEGAAHSHHDHDHARGDGHDHADHHNTGPRAA